MPDPVAIDALVRAGGWTLFVTTIVILAVGAMRKWIVLGWMYQREVDRNDRLEASLNRLTIVVRRLAAKKRDA